MSAARNMNAYLNTHYEGMSPEKLIQMLYKGALKHISLAREGITENSPKKRGENISRVIAIVTELYASLDPEMTDDSTQFLRGLYSSILAELPRVALTNNVKTLDLTYSYIEKLSQIWESDVMVSKQKPNTFKAQGSVYGQSKEIKQSSLFA